MKKIGLFLLAFVLLFTGYSNVSLAVEKGYRPRDGITYEQPFLAGTGGSTNFRIPCLVSLKDGTIVAACDARWNWAMDGGGLDTIVSYSKDYGKTWNYTFANYMGDNGNVKNTASTAFIDPALATDGENVYMIADLFPAGYALNGADYGPQEGANGLTAEGKLRLADATGADTNDDGKINREERLACNFDGYYLEKKSESVSDSDKEYYVIKDTSGNIQEDYSVDAFFNIEGKGVNTNLFFADSPFLPYPTDYLYLTKSEDGGATWSVPTLINAKREDERTLLIGPGNGIVTSKGRIVFTAYEHTGSGDEHTTSIYSDDKGKTWKRGETIADGSSEATLAEANGKLYMFTRHHNGYYVSDDFGENWSDKIDTGIKYASTTQMSVISYSKKIDGKSALLLSVPSDVAGRRTGGRIFVGLVDDKGIEWKYEYDINGTEPYAYSCIAELADGTIGLLYENAGSSIIYKNYTIDKIAKGAVVGDLWITDDKGNSVNEMTMGSGDSVSFNAQPAKQGDEITAISSDEEILTVNVVDNVVSLVVSDNIGSGCKVDVTISDGINTFTIPVYVTDEINHKIVNLRIGDTITCIDKSGQRLEGNIGDIDTNIATMDVIPGETIIYPYTGAQLADSMAAYDDEIIRIEDCLFTFTAKSGTTNGYVISHTAEDGSNIYLSHAANGAGAGYPLKTAEAVVTVGVESDVAEMFTLNNNSSYLYFWKNNSSKLHFDRQSNLDKTNRCTFFEIYAPSESAPADSPIPGYVKLRMLSDIQSGQQYLITAKDTSNNYYVLNPVSSGDKYNYVGKVVKVEEGPAITDTCIEFTGQREGQTSVKIGDTTYYIVVKNDEVTIDLKVGGSLVFAGSLLQSEEQNYVSIETIDSFAPYTAITDIAEGKYLIGNAGYIIANEAGASTSPHGLAMKTANYTSGDHGRYMWIVSASGAGYTIQDITGQYINFTEQSGSSSSVVLSDTPQVLNIVKRDDGSFGISYGNHYINNYGGSNNNAAGWNQNNNAWFFYSAPKQIKVIGLAEGTMTMTVGGTNYTVVVAGVQSADYRKVDEALAQIPNNLTVYTPKTLNILNEAIKAIDREQDYTKQQVVDGYAAAIEAAIAGLADIGRLRTLVNETKAVAYQQDDYTVKSWRMYATALEKAEQYVQDFEDLGKEEVDLAFDELTYAISNLFEKVEYKLEKNHEYSLLTTGSISEGDLLVIYSNNGTSADDNRILHSDGKEKTDKVKGTLSTDGTKLTLAKNDTITHEEQLWEVIDMGNNQIALRNVDTEVEIPNHRYLNLTENSDPNVLLTDTAKPLTIQATDVEAGLYTIKSAEPDGKGLAYKSATFFTADEPIAVRIFKKTEVPFSLADVTPRKGTTQKQPFTLETGSKDFRIPASITLKDGSIIAAADARWNHVEDGYAIDIILSKSKNKGETWDFSFPAYFADSTNGKHTLATCFIDPVLVSDEKDKIYLVTDLWPGGVNNMNGGRGNPNGPEAASGYVEIDGVKRLVLYTSPEPEHQDDMNFTYYVGDHGEDGFAPIYEALGNDTYSKEASYYVDKNFYLYTVDKEAMYTPQLNNESQMVQQNIFFYNSVLNVRCALYLYMITSTDGGESWSAPVILNPQVRKEENPDTFFGVGPGPGLCLEDGTIMIPCYSYNNGNQLSCFIYSEDDGLTWKRSENASTVENWSSESALVQLDETTVRQFFRSGNNNVQYTDHTLVQGVWKAGEVVTLNGITKRSSSGCQISAIPYSRTIDGKPVILYSTPSTPGGRTNGKIYVFTVDMEVTGKPMTLVTTYDIDPSTSSDFYAYSSLTELKDGTIGLLYENHERNNGEIKYINIPINELAPGIVFDEVSTETGDIIIEGNLTKVYDGKPVDISLITVEKEGGSGSVAYTFYKDSDKQIVLDTVPVYAGEYWVEASIEQEEGNIQGSNLLSFSIIEAELIIEDVIFEQIKAGENTVEVPEVKEIIFKGLIEEEELVKEVDYTASVTIKKSEKAEDNGSINKFAVVTVVLKETDKAGNYVLKETTFEKEVILPSASDNDPGVSENDPGVSGNDPGASDNDTTVSGYENIWVEGLEDKLYTGAKVTQRLKVYDGDKLLVEGADYTISYKNNVNACEFTVEELEAFEKAYREDPKTKANIGQHASKKVPQAVLKMKGNYTGTRSLFFQIIKPDISEDELFILDDVMTVTNTGNNKTPVPTVIWKYNGRSLKAKKDFTVDQTTEGSDTILVVKGANNFTGEKKVRLVITPDKNTIAMDQVKVSKIKPVDYQADGSLKPAEFTVKYKKATLTEGTHFEVSEVSANDITGGGTATVVLTAKEGATEGGYNFVGSKRISFRINTYPMSKVKADGLTAQTFTGDDINPLSMTDANGNPVVRLTVKGTGTLPERTLTADDYTVAYEKNVVKGTATVILTGVAERGVTGTKKLTFKISPAMLSNSEGSGFDVTIASDVSGNDNTVYFTKGGARPAVTIVRADGQTLVEGRDYTVAYKNNKDTGSADAVVKGKGNYTGQVSLTYTVEKKIVNEKNSNGLWIVVNDKVYNTKKNSWKQSFKILDSDGKALANKKDADIKNAIYTVYSLPQNAPEGIKVGDILSDPKTVLPEGAEVMITVTMAGNYDGKLIGTYRIINKDKDISKAKFQLKPQQYTGEAVIIDSNDDFAKRDLKGTILSMEDGQAFEVVEGSYINNIRKGTAKVTLKGVGEYGGLKTVTFKIGAKSVNDWFDPLAEYWK